MHQPQPKTNRSPMQQLESEILSLPCIPRTSFHSHFYLRVATAFAKECVIIAKMKPPRWSLWAVLTLMCPFLRQVETNQPTKALIWVLNMVRDALRRCFALSVVRPNQEANSIMIDLMIIASLQKLYGKRKQASVRLILSLPSKTASMSALMSSAQWRKMQEIISAHQNHVRQQESSPTIMDGSVLPWWEDWGTNRFLPSWMGVSSHVGRTEVQTESSHDGSEESRSIPPFWACPPMMGVEQLERYNRLHRETLRVWTEKTREFTHLNETNRVTGIILKHSDKLCNKTS